MPVTDARELGTILSIWAHPDDEGYCCGALMAEAVDAGSRVVCVTATRGELGSTDPERWPAGPELAAVRTDELAASLAVLGVTEHHWLDYPDGGCAESDADEAVGRLRELAADVRPDTVLTFGPDGGTFHPDHIAVSGWASAAVEGSGARVLHQTHTPGWWEKIVEVFDPATVLMGEGEVSTHEPDECAFYVEYTGARLEQKYRAMLCQASQIGPLVSVGGPELFRTLIAEEGFTERRVVTQALRAAGNPYS